MKQEIQITDEQLVYVTNEHLIDMVMRNSYEVEKFTETLTHLCFNNKNLSKQICQQTLNEITKTDFDRVSNYL